MRRPVKPCSKFTIQYLQSLNFCIVQLASGLFINLQVNTFLDKLGTFYAIFNVGRLRQPRLTGECFVKTGFKVVVAKGVFSSQIQ